jgi:hypothetical protein
VHCSCFVCHLGGLTVCVYRIVGIFIVEKQGLNRTIALRRRRRRRRRREAMTTAAAAIECVVCNRKWGVIVWQGVTPCR